MPKTFLFDIGSDDKKYYADLPSNTDNKKKKHNFDKPIPFQAADRYSNGELVGVERLNPGIKAGRVAYYSKDFDSTAKIYKDEFGEYYRISPAFTGNLNMDGMARVPYAEFRKLLPKRDYIGGTKDEARLKVMTRIPGLTEYIWNRARAYGVDPNLMLHRISKEGYADHVITDYNALDAVDQNDLWWNGIWDASVSGYGSFGLDDAASHLDAGYYELLDPKASWTQAHPEINEKGREIFPVDADNLNSAIEIMAAEMKYRQDELAKRGYIPKDKLNTYVNASFAQGLYHDDLENEQRYIEREYSYPDYYAKYNLKYKNGGDLRTPNERISELANRIKSSGYKFDAKKYATGGLVERYGSDKIRKALLKMRGQHRFEDGGEAVNSDGGYKIPLSQRKSIHGSWDPSIGFNLPGFYYSSKYGNLSRGEENEYWRAYMGLDNNVPIMNPNAKTEWDDKIEKEKASKGELPSDFYGTTPRMDQMIQVIADTLNTGNMLRNYDEYKKKYPSLAKKAVIEHIYNQGVDVMNNPGKWTQIKEGRNQIFLDDKIERNTNEQMPLGMLADFGMKWVPEEGVLRVHDTYDFPRWVTLLSNIPVRPKEMKIRGAIKFDPNRGSILLRDGKFNRKLMAAPIADRDSH